MDHVLGELGQRPQRLPPRLGLRARGFGVVEAEFTQHGGHRGGHVDVLAQSTFGDGVETTHRLPHLGAREERLAAAHLVRDALLGQRLFVILRLGVDAVEDRDLRRRHAVVDEPLDPLGDRGGLGRLVGVVDEAGRRAARTLADEFEPGPGDPSVRGTDHAIGKTHHLGGGPVVADQAHHGRLRETPGKSSR